MLLADDPEGLRGQERQEGTHKTVDLDGPPYLYHEKALRLQYRLKGARRKYCHLKKYGSRKHSHC